jgi:hypothetical protein
VDGRDPAGQYLPDRAYARGARPYAWLRVAPCRYRLFVEPHGEAASIDKGAIVLTPIAYPITEDRMRFGHSPIVMVGVTIVNYATKPLEALDYQFMGNRVQEDRPDLDLLPSEYFARNVYACYWFEQPAWRRLLDKVGVDNTLFETDFPHPTSLYGAEVHARITEGLSDCEESVRRKILWDNAQKLYKVEGPTAKDEAQRAVAASA